MKVYCLFEVTRHDGDILREIYNDKSVPERIAKHDPAGAMDGYYVLEWDVK